MLAIGAGVIAVCCAPAPVRGEEVKIASEEALIVWDAAHRTEHFIRRADFRSTGKRFGFLVPTPTLPKLTEASDGIFEQLAWEVRPRPVTEGIEIEAGSVLFETCMLAKGGDAAQEEGRAPVRVLASAHVAGLDATTLEADDAGALAGWLGRQGFDESPALTAWLAGYVKDHWKITAFVIATDASDAQGYDVSSHTVDMAFQIDKPFYPYREPAAETSDPDRMLRVWLVGDARYAATLAGQPWPARVVVSQPLTVRDPLLALAGPDARVTMFEDSGPRHAGDELYFAASSDKTDIRQTYKKPRHIMIPVDLCILVVVVALWWSRRRRRRTRA